MIEPELFYYKFQDMNSPFNEVWCNQQIDGEAAATYINATEGQKLGKAFTTHQTGTRSDYRLIQQVRDIRGLVDVGSIELFEALQ